MAAFGKKKKASEFPDVIPVSEAIRKGDIFTKLTCLIMGAGNLARKQIIQGLPGRRTCIYFLYGFLRGKGSAEFRYAGYRNAEKGFQ